VEEVCWASTLFNVEADGRHAQLGGGPKPSSLFVIAATAIQHCSPQPAEHRRGRTRGGHPAAPPHSDTRCSHRRRPGARSEMASPSYSRDHGLGQQGPVCGQGHCPARPCRLSSPPPGQELAPPQLSFLEGGTTSKRKQCCTPHKLLCNLASQTDHDRGKNTARDIASPPALESASYQEKPGRPLGRKPLAPGMPKDTTSPYYPPPLPHRR